MKQNNNSYGIFSFLFKQSLKKTLYILFMSVIAGVLGGAIVPVVINAAGHELSGHDYAVYTLALISMALILIVCKRISQKEIGCLSEYACEKLVCSIANRLRQKSLAEVEQIATATIYLRIAKAQNITKAATKSIDAFQNLIVLAVCWIYVFYLSSQAGLAILLIFFFAYVAYEVFQKVVKPLISEQSLNENKMFKAFRHLLKGFKELKLNRKKQNDIFDNFLKPSVRTTQNVRGKSMMLFAEYYLFIYICMFFTMAIDVFVLSPFYSKTVILQILTITLYMTTPVMIILAAIPDMTEGQVAIDEFLACSEFDEPDERIYDSSREIIKNFSELSFEEVCFSYNDKNTFTLGPINLKINAGEVIFVVGGNGCGKSTLMKIITGLYAPSTGVIKLNQRRVNMAACRYLFSAIFTDYHLFEALYGLSDIKDQFVNELISEMQISGKTKCENGKFTNIALSTGQKKRLGLIVSLLEDKPVYVFDEWAADQAPNFREYFYNSLLPDLKSKGKTVLVVTHDERYFNKADRVIKMEYGKIL